MSAATGGILKLAVKPLDEATGLAPQLVEFDQNRPLAVIIQQICGEWKLDEAERYALRYDVDAGVYITEKNRGEIKNGTFLRLERSPSLVAQDILDKLTNGTLDDQKDALKRLTALAADVTFAEEFINQQGSAMLISHLEKGTYGGDALSSALESFVKLMDHSIVFWDVLQPEFVKKTAKYVNNQAVSQEPQTLAACLAVLTGVMMNSVSMSSVVEQGVSLSNLVCHLENPEPDVQRTAMALINALFVMAKTKNRKSIASTLASKHVRKVIVASVIQGTHPVGPGLAHELYVLQTLQLNLLEDRMRTEVDPQDQDAMAKVTALRRIAFAPNGASALNVSFKRQDFKRLGFKNHANPLEDFAAEKPYGTLALDNMVYFARNHADGYAKVVMQNSCLPEEHACPFGVAGIELTKRLCQILKIGERPSYRGRGFFPMFFTHDHPFEEFFCVCIVLLNKTWKEMRATTEDFVKVLSVVREQVTRALSQDPAPATFDVLKGRLNALPYGEITSLLQQERSKRELEEWKEGPVKELREHVAPEIAELVQGQRLSFLALGTTFTKYNAKGARNKDKYWYCRLAPNRKTLHFGDCDDNSRPALEQLPNKVPIADVEALVTGGNCPHVKKGSKSSPLAFSLILRTEDPSSESSSLDFVASCEKEFDYWTDGINSLLGSAGKMVSREAKNDAEKLLDVDLKLRLLALEGITVPKDPPPIPEDPSNYDFYHAFKL